MPRPLCWICGKQPSYCTNGVCADCHPEHCTGGGVTSSGHNLRPTAVQASIARQSRDEQERSREVGR